MPGGISCYGAVSNQSRKGIIQFNVNAFGAGREKQKNNWY